MKNINARVSEKSEKFLTENFRSKGAGAEYILAALPAASRKFIGLDMKGRFTSHELKLMIDVMNGTILTPEIAGLHLPINVRDGIALDGLDEKWSIDGKALEAKLTQMSTPELLILEIWIQGFWQAVPTDCGQDLDEYIAVALPGNRA